MKRILATLAILLMAGALHAERRIKKDGIEFPQRPMSLISDAVYMTSVTCNDNSAAGRQVVISTAPSYLFAVNITSAGLGSPIVQLFDSSISTGAGDGNDPTRQKIRALTPPIDAKVSSNYQDARWSVGTSSGIALWNHGDNVAPCVAITYVER